MRQVGSSNRTGTMKIAAALAMLVLASNPVHASATFSFCSFSGKKPSQEGIRIDFSTRRLSSADTSSSFRVVQSDFAVGLENSIPLSLPKRKVRSNDMPLHWRLERYDYTATLLNPTDADWMLIYATPVGPSSKPAPKPKFSAIDLSSVLYSQSKGVLALRHTTVVNGKAYADDMYACGNGKIFPESFLSKMKW